MVEASTFETRHLVAPEHAQHVTSHSLEHECPDIYLDDHAMDIRFSPTCNLLTVAQVTGVVRVYAYSETTMDEVLTLN
jgi:hypothetical protein